MNHLQLLVDEIRSKLLRQLDKTADAEMLTPVPGLQNHLTWHAGHCLWVAGELVIKPLTGSTELPDGWAETYGMHCRPPAESSDWASRERLIELLTAQKDRLIDLLADDPAGGSADGDHEARARQVIHGLHDEACHQGEIQVLRKWQRAR
jgi:hypothetical protein